MTFPSRKLTWFVPAIVSLLVAWSARAQSIDTAAVDAIIEDARKEWSCPGAAVVIVKDDKVIHLKGYGVKEYGKSDPVTPDTIFNTGSTGKSYTALAVAIMVDQGEMNWDDPVRKHIPYFKLADPEADANVTLRDLCCHRVGLARHDLLWRHLPPLSREEIIRRVAHLKLERPFRSTMLYNNLMFVTAGVAAGAAYGGTYEDVVQKCLFDPLGMKTANFSFTTMQKTPDYARGHERDGRRARVIPFRNLDSVGPAGSINACARDLGQWLRFQLGDGTIDGKRIISTAGLAETHKPHVKTPLQGRTQAILPYAENAAYCLGWNSHTDRGHQIIWHGGGGPTGFRTQIMLAPEKKLGVAVVCNIGGVPQLPEPVINGIFDLALGFPKQDWTKKITDATRRPSGRQETRTKPRPEVKRARELSSYAGVYEEPAYGKVDVRLSNGSLVFQWGGSKSPLKHENADTFRIADVSGPQDLFQGFETVAFNVGSNGETTMKALGGMTFKRTK